METRERTHRRADVGAAAAIPGTKVRGRGAKATARANGARSIGAATPGEASADVDARILLSTLTRFRKGDFTARLPIEWTGLAGKIADTFNDVIELNQRMTGELERLTRMVGKEGRSNQRGSLAGFQGSWAKSMDAVNSLIDDLVYPTSEMARVIGAVAKGDLSQTMGLEIGGRSLEGEALRTAQTVNRVVDQLRSFASEVTRVAREVGTEGKLGGQADVKGVAGTWQDLTDSVNSMARNLTAQVRNIADVTKAVAAGDLSRKITVDVRGEILELKDTVNTMVDQLRSFAAEVTRVAREVGTEGKLGGQADVKGVAGTWKDLTDSVNSMASNLTGQVRNIADVTKAVAAGDLSRKITVDVRGEILELKDTVNTMVDQLRSFAAEVTRVAREVGTEGKLGGQADVKGVAGTWKDLTDSVNSMASNLTSQVRNIAAVTTAVANGDLSKKITVDVKGEILELKETINAMVDQLRSFAAEVTRVAREVGTEGKLGGQASVPGVSGTWKDLTEHVNFMAGNLTTQVRNIAKVVTAVAQGDLTEKLTVDAKGEIAALANTINGMIDTLETFADQVTSVAREVGIEGKLGGQASVPGASGTWKLLTDNVNQLAANLTTQVRAIAEVATAVTEGDLTRSIAVEASGEVASLKDNINEMIRNLKDQTLKNSEQDWLKTNLAKFSRMLQGQRDLLAVARMILSELAPMVGAQHGVFYIMEEKGGDARLRLLASYAHRLRKHGENVFDVGEGLVGQAALEREKIVLTRVPPDYIQITSGLGEAPPLSVIVLPVLFEGAVKAVLELASFERFSATHEAFLDQLMETIGIALNTIQATSRTEYLLEQSQSLANELQSGQQELQKTNAELEDKARLLAEQNVEVERKNSEVEQARRALEEKASQLALTSKYKSEFLANMSHELRTPLNSLLILAEQLSGNVEGNLNDQQVEYARTIHGSGNDLLKLINDILDLAKIESGTVTVEVGEWQFQDLEHYLERTFRPIAESRGLGFSIVLDPKLPRGISTDPQRLQQVLRNLLSNAFKFTERGVVTLRIGPATGGWSPDQFALNRSPAVVCFSVLDSGIGIHPEKQSIIFEAFQQADGSTNRRYGGTGLGLAISRELARLLGGEIRLRSVPNEGSTFDLYLPQTYVSTRLPKRETGMPVEYRHSAPAVARLPEPPADTEPIDDRTGVLPGDRLVLVVEDDPTYAQIVREAAHANGFKAYIEPRGAMAVALARELRPDAITLDLHLPDIDGRRVLRRLKADLATRHIPVHVISVEPDLEDALRAGARGALVKPASANSLQAVLGDMRRWVDRPTRDLLLLSPDDALREQARQLIGNGVVVSVEGTSAREGLELLSSRTFDCVVLDPVLPDLPGLQLIEDVVGRSKQPVVPFVVYAPPGRLPEGEEQRLERLMASTVVRPVLSLEELFDGAMFFLHRVATTLPDEQRHILERLHEAYRPLTGRTVLIVDDDVRNIFAMTSLLERHGMHVVSAETGAQALRVLEAHPEIAVVLMDIMLPEIDGYETTRAIRAREHWRDLPVVALTAKAMKGDREKCIDAGASDYLAKPVDTTHLLSTLSLWLTQ